MMATVGMFVRSLRVVIRRLRLSVALVTMAPSAPSAPSAPFAPIRADSRFFRKPPEHRNPTPGPLVRFGGDWGAVWATLCAVCVSLLQ